MKLSAYGDGSVYQRKDGRWTATFYFQGKRYDVYGATRAAAVAKRRERRQALEKGEIGGRKRGTFAMEAKRWIDSTSLTSGLSELSRGNYASVLNVHVLPVIGAMRVGDIRPSDVSRVLVEMANKGLSPSYRHQAHKVMSHVFKQAVADRRVSGNPVRDVPAPRGTVQKKVVPTASQVRALIEASPDERTRTVVALLGHTGARIGEVLGLTWPDIDFERGRIAIRRGKGGKSRSVALTPTLAAQLKRWRKVQASQRLAAAWWSQDEWIVTTDIGTALDAHNFRKKHFAPLASMVAPGVTPHSLRHAFATLMLEEGVPVKVVAEQLGHSSTRITEDTYSHVTARLVDEAGVVAERVLGGQV